MSAMFALPGVVAAGIMLDWCWAASRYLIEAQAVSIVLILLGAWRDRQNIDMGSPAGLAFVGGLGVMLAGCIVLYAVEQRASRGTALEPAAPAA
jgi:hypothetical protein